MRRTLVIGNWKMHGSRESTEALLSALKGELSALASTDVAVCPPYPYIPVATQLLAGSAIGVGAQNVAEELEGAFTGEVSATMLADMGCRFGIVGHSERRAIFAESDQQIAVKFMRLQQQGITPVLCVGESLEQREAGETLAVVGAQLQAVIAEAGIEALANAVVAYEPIWAIGTGRTATPEQAQEVHAYIRGLVAEQDSQIAELLPLLYGGSVKAANAAELFAQPDIDGGLVGGASLQADEFAALCQAAE